MKNKTIGFFGGSFDPIHSGHIHLATMLQEVCGLTTVLFCPAFVSPFKVNKRPSSSASHRREMVKRAIAPIPSFSLYDFELLEEKPSYTIDTLLHLKTSLEDQSQTCDIRLILGADMLADLPQWKEIDQVLEIAPPLVGARSGSFHIPEELSARSKRLLTESIVQIPMLDISSTDLRQRLKKRLYCGHLMGHDVLEYIYQNKLYQ